MSQIKLGSIHELLNKERTENRLLIISLSMHIGKLTYTNNSQILESKHGSSEITKKIGMNLFHVEFIKAHGIMFIKESNLISYSTSNKQDGKIIKVGK